jgi:hypothetical protein
LAFLNSGSDRVTCTLGRCCKEHCARFDYDIE